MFESLDVQAGTVADPIEKLRLDRRVVRIVPLPTKELLNDYPWLRTASPKCNQEFGPVTIIPDLTSKSKTVDQVDVRIYHPWLTSSGRSQFEHDN